MTGESPKPPVERRDRRLDVALARVLRVCVQVAAVVVGAGVVLHLVQQPRAPVPEFGAFVGQREGLTTIAAVLAGAARGEGMALAQLGVALLIATPAVRVLTTLVGFVVRRDAVFVVLSAVVLITLLLSLVL